MTTNPDRDASSADVAAEAQPIEDGAVDVRNEGPPPRPCETAGHWICDDFDDRDAGSTVASQWTPSVAPGGAIAIVADSDAKHSPPNVLRATVSSASTASVNHSKVGKARGLSCSFSMRIVEGALKDAVLFDMGLSGSGFYGTAIRAQPGGSVMLSRSSTSPDGGPPTPNVNDPFSLGFEWHRIVLAVAAGATPAATITVDGMQLTLQEDPRLGQFVDFEQESVLFGLNTSGSWTVLYDDILCVAIP